MGMVGIIVGIVVIVGMILGLVFYCNYGGQGKGSESGKNGPISEAMNESLFPQGDQNGKNVQIGKANEGLEPNVV